ncbi:PRC-barrel domain-containing protein [Evansella cellulosilytica]|uniref:PRC-barrel domain protein n=1 Tax=Evansella cellulosilytica (strain ATCC 21833 / DSM 2522 / FERM P-1141 / JCM 9156 / N-4) TaxID=649639 RepID=E6TVY8_EVAC2|nr:PRC-barrel domain-containing protein [Evansella cellulosilytica]ADU29811.1 PRC-barrel domain protein [Evansella cellulosilytica DSM 2522]
MLLHFNAWLASYSVFGKSGELGKVSNAFFDEEHWTVRFLEVKSGHIFNRDKLYVSPASITYIDHETGGIHVNLTKDEAEKAPLTGEEEKITRKHEHELLLYYGLHPYWHGGGTWGNGALTARELQKLEENHELVENEQIDSGEENAVHDAKDVIGYEVSTINEQFGKVIDLLIEEETYTIKYFVVDLRKFLPGKKVLLPTDVIRNVNWVTRQMEIEVSKEQVEQAPEYLSNVKMTLERQREIDRFYMS